MMNLSKIKFGKKKKIKFAYDKGHMKTLGYLI